jgi:hypothetical protein
MTYSRLTANAVLLLYWTTAALGGEAPAGVKLSNPLAAQSLEQLSAIVNRPLFSPNRRPPLPPVAQTRESAPPPSPLPDLVLSGIVMDGESARAVVRVGAEKKSLRAQIGDDIGGWKVSQIEGRKLVLSLDGHSATFTLFNRGVDQRTAGDGTGSKVSDRSANAPGASQQQQQNAPPAGQQPIGQR